MFHADQTGAMAPTAAPGQPHHEEVVHVLYGSLVGIQHTIKILHSRGYADPNDWSTPIPSGRARQWMSLLTKRLLIRQSD